MTKDLLKDLERQHVVVRSSLDIQRPGGVVEIPLSTS